MSHDVVMPRVAPRAGHNATTRPRLPGTGLLCDAVPTARIYRPARSATTSAPLQRPWIVEFERRDRPALEPLMGWTTQSDPLATVRLTFPTLGSALDFVHEQGWPYELRDPAPHAIRPAGRRGRARRKPPGPVAPTRRVAGRA